MTQNEEIKLKLEITARMCKSFVTDFMPMMENVKHFAADLTTENLTTTQPQILQETERAISLLKQINRLQAICENDRERIK